MLVCLNYNPKYSMVRGKNKTKKKIFYNKLKLFMIHTIISSVFFLLYIDPKRHYIMNRFSLRGSPMKILIPLKKINRKKATSEKWDIIEKSYVPDEMSFAGCNVRFSVYCVPCCEETIYDKDLDCFVCENCEDSLTKDAAIVRLHNR